MHKQIKVDGWTQVKLKLQLPLAMWTTYREMTVLLRHGLGRR